MKPAAKIALFGAIVRRSCVDGGAVPLADLCVAVARSGGDPGSSGVVVASSERGIRRFVGCSVLLEPGVYCVTALGAFNRSDVGTTPKYGCGKKRRISFNK